MNPSLKSGLRRPDVSVVLRIKDYPKLKQIHDRKLDNRLCSHPSGIKQFHIHICRGLARLERTFIIDKLDENDQNKTQTAKVLGISRRTLHRKIRRYNLA